MESVFKNLHISGRKCCLRVDGRCNLHFRKYPDTCGWGLRCETASGIVLCYTNVVIKHVAFFAVCATLTMAVTLASLLLIFCSSVSGCGCGFRFEQKYLRIDGFGHKNYPLPSALDYVYIREDTIYHLLV